MEIRTHDLPISYRLQTVKIGVQATWLALGALIAYAALPETRIDVTPYLILVGVAAAGVAVIRLLPWARLFEGPWGLRLLYAWSLFDIVLITGLIAVTGGGQSHLFLLYALTTVFFATSYPASAQFLMLLVTYVGYVIVVAATGWAEPAGVVLRMLVLGVITTMTSFLASELIRQSGMLRKETEDRINAEDRLQAARDRQEQALQLNDSVVQGLSLAKMSLEMGDIARADAALSRTLEDAKGIVSDLLMEAEQEGRLRPGTLARVVPPEPAPEAIPLDREASEQIS